ncbi:hypothetical protein ABZ753_14530 [Streptomyces griseoincarnatus]
MAPHLPAQQSGQDYRFERFRTRLLYGAIVAELGDRLGVGLRAG